MEARVDKTDELVMKLLHYFITEQGYNPIILQGAQNEIWLENLNNDHEIVRIVSNYIHNDEQLDFDIYRTKKIMKKIKKKTMSFSMNALSIFINLGDNVNKDNTKLGNVDCAYIETIDDLNKYDFITSEFPTITNNTDFKEKGMELFMKLTSEITKKSESETMKAEEVFAKKKPIITYSIIAINIIVFILMYLFGSGSTHVGTLLKFGANYGVLVRLGQYYRLLTCAFLHIGLVHLLLNSYALYVIGPQVESFYGKTKYTIIYIMSAIFGSLLSILFSDGISAGASGAIFGLLGATLYFGYHYRVYLDGVLKSQIIPLIVMNLALGFILNGIDNAAHIGGLIGGILVSMALGVKYKSTTSERINGIIMSLILMGFLIFMIFFRGV